jgi:hypothetical protein
MKVKRLEVLGYEWAVQAMRQPFLSKSNGEHKDKELANKLISAGREHRKFMRQITIQMEFSASMAFLAEFDTYKIGCTRNSQSFWNTWKGEFTDDDFVQPVWEYYPKDGERALPWSARLSWIKIIESLNYLKDLGCPKEVLRYLVPQGINYNGIFTLTGETYLNMLKQRQNHRLPEWIEFLTQTILMIELLHNDFYQLLDVSIDRKSKLYMSLSKYQRYNPQKNTMESCKSVGFTSPDKPAEPGLAYFEK